MGKLGDDVIGSKLWQGITFRQTGGKQAYNGDKWKQEEEKETAFSVALAGCLSHQSVSALSQGLLVSLNVLKTFSDA
jgi:hypothetical protein